MAAMMTQSSEFALNTQLCAGMLARLNLVTKAELLSSMRRTPPNSHKDFQR